ncbi:MAG: DUF2711 family protein [Candidatus Sericytochromatia bacterium]
MEIFEPVIYPENEIFLEYFNKYSDSVFIAFNPFFRINGENNNQNYHLSSLKVNSETKSEDKTLNYLIDSLGTNGKSIYFPNPDYPEFEEIVEKAEIIKWETIKKECNFNDYSELSIALRTSIGGLKKEYSRPDLCEKLTVFCENNKIWMPTEGSFNALVQLEIKRILKLNGVLNVIVQNEFGDEKKEASVEELEDNIYYGIKNIYTISKNILFTVDWDSFYFLFCSNREVIEKSLGWWEGFYCNEKTKHFWEIE